MTVVENLLATSGLTLAQESFETILETAGFRLERIVSAGHVTPSGEWYEQERAEWVVVVQGEARLVFEGDPAALRLRPGDHVLIPAHRRHRVEWTDPTQHTVWLALHYSP